MSIIGTSVFRSNDYPSQTTHSEHVFALTSTTCGQSGLWSREGWGWAHCVPLIPRYTLDKLANDYRLREMQTSQSHLHQEVLRKHVRPQFYSQSFFFIVFRVHLKLLCIHQRSLNVSNFYTLCIFLYRVSMSR